MQHKFTMQHKCVQDKGKNVIPRVCPPRCFINYNMALGFGLACKETCCSLLRYIVGLQLLHAREVVLVLEELDGRYHRTNINKHKQLDIKRQKIFHGCLRGMGKGSNNPWDPTEVCVDPERIK